MITDCGDFKKRIEHLERELDEMTVALSQAWDQLVPLLQDVSVQAETTEDIEPILHSIATATNTNVVGIYLCRADEWHNIPKPIYFSEIALQKLKNITHEQVLYLDTEQGELMQWAFAPVMSEGKPIAFLGIGTYETQRAFTALNLRIIVRMAERISNQISVALLSRLRAKEQLRNHDMEVARNIQKSIQPIESPKTPLVQLASYWQPSKEVGGDAWGWVQRSAENIVWFILDVAGKGLPAALAAVSLHTAITMALVMHRSPVETLKIVNSQFYEPYTRTDLMATAAILSLNTRSGILELANAGHPPILVRQQNHWLRLAATAPPLGVLPNLNAEPQVVQLHADDLVIAYSDGFTEIQIKNRLWGQTGLINTIPVGAKDVQALIDHIVTISQRIGIVEDDQTLIAALYKDT